MTFFQFIQNHFRNFRFSIASALRLSLAFVFLMFITSQSDSGLKGIQTVLSNNFSKPLVFNQAKASFYSEK